MTASVSLPDPWLSVVMPVHEGGRWLAETLESVAANDCQGIELLVWDSSAGTECRDIVDRFADRLFIRYRACPQIKPWPSKTNLAVSEARGQYVVMLHQDDLWLPGRVAHIQKSIAAAPDAALLLNPSHIVDSTGRRLGLWRCPLPALRPLHGTQVAKRLLVQNFIAIPSPIIQRDAWIAVGGMDETLWYTGDWDLYLKLLSQGPIYYNPSPSTAFRVHGSSLTVTGSTQKREFQQQMATVIERHSGLVPLPHRRQVLRRAQASLSVNCGLAAARAGHRDGLTAAALALLQLGPFEGARYLRDSRLIERVLPRLRAGLLARAA